MQADTSAPTLSTILELPGLLDLGDAVIEENFSIDSSAFSDRIDEANHSIIHEGLLTSEEEAEINHLCGVLSASLVSWTQFNNDWETNRRALILFMMASPAFEPVRQQLLDEDIRHVYD